MELRTVKMEITEGANIVIGQAHFIKSVEDIYEVMVGHVPNASLELPSVRLLVPVWYGRKAMKDLIEIAVRNASSLASGHAFVNITILFAIQNVFMWVKFK